MDILVGVDCGASHMRVGLLDTEGQMLAWQKTGSPLRTEPLKLASKISEQVLKLWDTAKLGQDNKLIGLGLGVPGPLDPISGLIDPAANLNNQIPIRLCEQFQTVFNTFQGQEVPVYFDRDTNLALLGEYWQGVAKDVKSAVMLTVGTGVGGAILINGELYRGKNFRAAELGHMVIKSRMINLNPPTGGQNLSDKPIVCGLGHVGCLEGLVQQSQNQDELSYWLGIGLANILQIFDPEMIILGGGKTQFEDILPSTLKVIEAHSQGTLFTKVKVCYAKLGDLSGVYGGAKLVLNHQR